jgi:hypothetical protein
MRELIAHAQFDAESPTREVRPMDGLMPEKREASEPCSGAWYAIPSCPGCGHAMLDLGLGAEMGGNPMRYECPECEITFVSDASGLLIEVDGLYSRTR